MSKNWFWTSKHLNFLRNRYWLKKCPKVWTFNLQRRFFHQTHLELIFSIFFFFSKKCIPYQFYEELHFEYSGYHRVVKLVDIKKLILVPFRSVKIDYFSYSTHENPMRTRWDRVCEKKNSHFFTCGHNPLLITLKDFIQFSVRA